MPPRTRPAARPARAPRGTLNRGVIVAAAIALAERDGLGALTMRRLAEEELGVRQMSLYTHFRSKDEILQAVRIELLDSLEWPDPTDDHLESLRQLLRAYFRLLVDHPVLLEIAAAAVADTDVATRVAEAMYGCLMRLEIDHRTAMGLVASLMRFILGSAMVYPTHIEWDFDPTYWERVRTRLAELPVEHYPALHDMTTDFPVFSQQEVFEFGLDSILARISSTEPATRIPDPSSGKA